MNIRGERVLVTGGTGFLGRHLVPELEQSGARAISVGSADYDLRERDQIRQMLADHRPVAVIHLAAVLGGIAANQAEPGRFFYENAVMGLELIEACRVAGVTKTVIAGTISAYPKTASLPFVESEFWNGYPHENEAPFAMAKKLLAAQVDAYRQQYGMNVIYLVPANLYGPGHRLERESSHVIPSMVRKFLEGHDQKLAEVTLWGDGTPTREFLYVQDAAQAFRLALESYDRAEPLNIGSGDEVSIRDLARLIQRAVGYEGAIRWDASRPNGQPRRRLYSSNAHRFLGFEAATPLEDGIARTVAWARDGLAPAEAQARS